METILLDAITRLKPTGERMTILPPQIGIGKIETIQLPSNIWVTVYNHQAKRPMIVESKATTPVFGFGFCLTGYLEARPPGFKDSFIIKGGQSAFFSLPDAVGYHTDNLSRERVIRVFMSMDADYLLELAGEYTGDIPHILAGKAESCRRVADELTPFMQQAVTGIINCPYSGKTRKLFLEGKVMELLVLKLEQLKSNNTANSREPRLKPSEIDGIRHVARMLSQNLEHHPDIEILARSVDMSRSKLYCCFRKVYGLSPFEYLRNRRLETAVSLLRDGKMNVGEVAYSVGYSSLSHFAKAFKGYCGMPPSEYLRTSS